jgi:hypothetical protein
VYPVRGFVGGGIGGQYPGGGDGVTVVRIDVDVAGGLVVGVTVGDVEVTAEERLDEVVLEAVDVVESTLIVVVALDVVVGTLVVVVAFTDVVGEDVVIVDIGMIVGGSVETDVELDSVVVGVVVVPEDGVESRGSGVVGPTGPGVVVVADTLQLDTRMSPVPTPLQVDIDST